MGLAQWMVPICVFCHSCAPVSGLRARRLDVDATYKTPLATRGDVPAVVLDHTWLSDGFPLPSNTSFRPIVPLPLATKAHVLESAGFTQTAGAVSTTPFPGAPIVAPISPPVLPGAPLPL